MYGQTYNHVHTLDLVFTMGVKICSLKLLDMTVSDHKCLVFTHVSTVSPRFLCTRIFKATLGRIEKRGDLKI